MSQTSQPISEEWLKENGFVEPEEFHSSSWMCKRFVSVEVVVRHGEVMLFGGGMQYVALDGDWHTARLIKLIEALTGKEWDGK